MLNTVDSDLASIAIVIAVDQSERPYRSQVFLKMVKGCPRTWSQYAGSTEADEAESSQMPTLW